jgi:hypothetical protein
MIGQNGATKLPGMRPESIRTGAAALVSGWFRVRFGRLILSDYALVFFDDGDGTEIVMPLTDMAWIGLSPRTRKLTLQVTLRSARIHHFQIDSPDWVSLLGKARERALVAPPAIRHYQPISASG